MFVEPMFVEQMFEEQMFVEQMFVEQMFVELSKGYRWVVVSNKCQNWLSSHWWLFPIIYPCFIQSLSCPFFPTQIGEIFKWVSCTGVCMFNIQGPNYQTILSKFSTFFETLNLNIELSSGQIIRYFDNVNCF